MSEQLPARSSSGLISLMQHSVRYFNDMGDEKWGDLGMFRQRGGEKVELRVSDLVGEPKKGNDHPCDLADI